MRPSSPASVRPLATCFLELPGQLWLYGWKDIDVVLWQSSPSAPAVQRMSRVLPQRMGSRGNRVSVVHVMYPGTHLPDHEAREELSAIGRRWHDAVACIGLVVEGDSLRLSAWRGMLTGLIAVSPVRRTVTVTANLADMATWLARHHALKTGVSHGQGVLFQLLDGLRHAHP